MPLVENIKETYHINENTLVLNPARNINYYTTVIETNRRLYTTTPPRESGKAACYDEWYTYEGRRRAVIYHTNFTRTVPIPIKPQKDIYLFPTNAPNSFENI